MIAENESGQEIGRFKYRYDPLLDNHNALSLQKMVDASPPHYPAQYANEWIVAALDGRATNFGPQTGVLANFQGSSKAEQSGEYTHKGGRRRGTHQPKISPWLDRGCTTWNSTHGLDEPRFGSAGIGCAAVHGWYGDGSLCSELGHGLCFLHRLPRGWHWEW